MFASKGDHFDSEKVKSLILNQIDSLIIRIHGIGEEIKDDLSQLSKWIKKASELVEDFEDKIPIDELSEDDEKQIMDVFDQMKDLPMISKSKKSLFNDICILRWLLKVQKIFKEASSGKKQKFEVWTELDKQIKSISKSKLIISSSLYKRFKDTYEMGVKMQDLFNKKKSKSARVKIEELEQVTEDARKCSIDLSEEIESLNKNVSTFKELQEKFESIMGQTCDINQYNDLLKSLRECPFNIDKEEKQINKIKKDHEEIKKTVKNYLVSLMNKTGEKSLKLSKIDHTISKYKQQKCGFAEGEKLIEERECNFTLFNSLKDTFAKAKKKGNILWDDLMRIENDLKGLKIIFEAEEDVFVAEINQTKPLAFAKQFEQFIKDSKPPMYKFNLEDAEKLYKKTENEDEIMQDDEEGTIDEALLKQLEEHITRVSKEIEQFDDYDKCKEAFDKSKESDIINFEVLFTQKLKDLKNVKMKELAKKRQEARRKKDEERKQNMKPEEYSALKKKEKISRKNRAKTDCYLDKGVDDDWDARYLKYAEPDLELPQDALEKEHDDEGPEDTEDEPKVKKRDKKDKAKTLSEAKNKDQPKTEKVKGKTKTKDKPTPRNLKKSSKSEDTVENSNEKKGLAKKLKDSRSNSEGLNKSLKKVQKKPMLKSSKAESEVTSTTNKETKATESQEQVKSLSNSETKPAVVKKVVKKVTKPIKATEEKVKKPAKEVGKKIDNDDKSDHDSKEEKSEQNKKPAEAPKAKIEVGKKKKSLADSLAKRSQDSDKTSAVPKFKNTFAKSTLASKPLKLVGKKRMAGVGGGGSLAASLKKINK